MDRREFTSTMALGSFLIALHPEPMFNSLCTETDTSASLIRRISLQTTATPQDMISFYNGSFGLKVIESTKDHVSFFAGDSILTFSCDSDQKPAPWYHFAFNIPENMLMKARDWLMKRVGLITTPSRLRDPKYPKDVRHFRNWNAHSLFFWDPGGNLVEFIARHELDNASSDEFSSRNILNISEIGLVVDNQQIFAETLNAELSIDAYPSGTNNWWAMGDANGLLLSLRKRLWAAGTEDEKVFGIFDTKVDIRHGNHIHWDIDGYPYEISS